MAGFWEQFLQGAGGAYGYNEMLGQFDAQRDDINSGISGLQDYVTQNSQFQPFSIRGSGGNSTFNKNGMNFGLNQQQQGIQDQMFGGGMDLLGRSMQDTSGREEDIYQTMRAAQRPEEQRQQSMMQNTASSQGRGGIRSEQYGGTPEQLAFAKAQQEQMAGSRFGAMDQARQEQTQQYNQGLGMLGAGYEPMNQARQQGAMGMDFQQLLQRPQEQMTNLYAQLGLGGMGSQVNMSNISGNAFGNMINAGTGMLGGIGGAMDGFDWSSIFGPSA